MTRSYRIFEFLETVLSKPTFLRNIIARFLCHYYRLIMHSSDDYLIVYLSFHDTPFCLFDTFVFVAW